MHRTLHCNRTLNCYSKHTVHCTVYRRLCQFFYFKHLQVVCGAKWGNTKIGFMLKKNWESWGPDIKIALIEMAKSHWPEVQNLLYYTVRISNLEIEKFTWKYYKFKQERTDSCRGRHRNRQACPDSRGNGRSRRWLFVAWSTLSSDWVLCHSPRPPDMCTRRAPRRTNSLPRSACALRSHPARKKHTLKAGELFKRNRQL